MRQVDWAVAQHLLSPFSSPFFGMKVLYDYGFWSSWLISSHGIWHIDRLHGEVYGLYVYCDLTGLGKNHSPQFQPHCYSSQQIYEYLSNEMGGWSNITEKATY